MKVAERPSAPLPKRLVQKHTFRSGIDSKKSAPQVGGEKRSWKGVRLRPNKFRIESEHKYDVKQFLRVTSAPLLQMRSCLSDEAEKRENIVQRTASYRFRFTCVPI